MGDEYPPFIIAEIGHNHQGNVEKAKQLFKAAQECGVSAVKLQKRSNRTLYTRKLYEQPYDNENSFGSTYGAHREALEFGKAEYLELQAYARSLNLIFFATAFDFESADFLAALDMPAYKFASGDLLNTPLQKHVAKIGKPMFLSTGGGTMEDIRRACDAILPINPQLSILHCTASYPADVGDLNLRVIGTLRDAYPDKVIGLSDHENGIDCAIVAYMLGARVFEKHFTMNHSWKGTDHAFSLEPVGMRKMVRDLGRIPVAMGDGIKRHLACEDKPLLKMSKKLVAARALPEGHILTEADVAMKSPGDGLPPHQLEKVIGCRLKHALAEDDAITFDALAGV
jgi:N-acetylneuraminate synthase/sialic acid synthase